MGRGDPKSQEPRATARKIDETCEKNHPTSQHHPVKRQESVGIIIGDGSSRNPK